MARGTPAHGATGAHLSRRELGYRPKVTREIASNQRICGVSLHPARSESATGRICTHRSDGGGRVLQESLSGQKQAAGPQKLPRHRTDRAISDRAQELEKLW